ncbi:Unknown protein, partial [Striga hermonthica]
VNSSPLYRIKYLLEVPKMPRSIYMNCPKYPGRFAIANKRSFKYWKNDQEKVIVCCSDEGCDRKNVQSDDFSEGEDELLQDKSIYSWRSCIKGEGQIFSVADEFRKSVKSYAIANKRSFNYRKNDKQKVIVCCSDVDCEWRVYASLYKWDHQLAIRKCNLVHTCVLIFIPKIKQTLFYKHFIKHLANIDKKIKQIIRNMIRTRKYGKNPIDYVNMVRTRKINILINQKQSVNFKNTNPPQLKVHNLLIPKVENPVSLKQFMPISLLNVIYKLLTKVLTEQLKPILPDIVNLAQASFVPGRQISDNILVAQEVLHSLRRKTGRRGFMLIKVDLEKAYDFLSWDFIRDTLVLADFPLVFVNTIMK